MINIILFLCAILLDYWLILLLNLFIIDRIIKKLSFSFSSLMVDIWINSLIKLTISKAILCLINILVCRSIALKLLYLLLLFFLHIFFYYLFNLLFLVSWSEPFGVYNYIKLIKRLLDCIFHWRHWLRLISWLFLGWVCSIGFSSQTQLLCYWICLE